MGARRCCPAGAGAALPAGTAILAQLVISAQTNPASSLAIAVTASGADLPRAVIAGTYPARVQRAVPVAGDHRRCRESALALTRAAKDILGGAPLISVAGISRSPTRLSC